MQVRLQITRYVSVVETGLIIGRVKLQLFCCRCGTLIKNGCWQLNIAAAWIIYPWICLVGEVLSPLKILLWLCILAVPQVHAVSAARCPSELSGRPTKLDHSCRNRKPPFFLSFTHQQQYLRNRFSASYSASLCRFGISGFSAQENGTHEGEY